MRSLHVLLSLSMLGLGACAPAWTGLDLFSGYDFSYVVGTGEGSDLQSARLNAENHARSRVQLSKALHIAVTQNDSSLIREVMQENEQARTSVLTRELFSQLSVEVRGDTVPPSGWRMYGGKEHTESISSGFRVSAVYQFQPEEVKPGKWLVNRIPEEFPGMKGPPSRATSILQNAILPGWGMQAMGKDRRGTAFMAVYLASWAGWGIARWKRGGHIRTLNQSTNAIEQENLIRRVNRYGGIKNGLLGVAAATWLTSLVDGFTGQPDLFEFSSDGRGAGVSFRFDSR